MSLPLFTLVSAAQATPPVVSNIRASQRAGTHLIDLYYNVSDADGNSPLTVYVTVSDNAGASYNLPVSSPRSLQVEQSGADVILSWPVSALNYTLVSVASLTDTNWLAVTNPPVLTELRQQVTNTVNSGSRFYRLCKP
jgi:hypothetical protein